MMTLEEAIEHAKEKIDTSQCGREHQQLYEWLLELRKLREEKKLQEKYKSK